MLYYTITVNFLYKKNEEINMKKLILAITMMFLSVTAHARDKLYVVNTGSTGGSFNAIMSATTQDLKAYYDIEYVQAKGCAKGGSVVQKLVDNGQKAFFIWNGLKVASAYEGIINKNKACLLLPNVENFVRADLKYGMMFTKKGGIDASALFGDKQLTIGFNHTAIEALLKGFIKHHGLNHKTIRYENSKAIVMGALSGEVDMAVINSGSSFWKKAKKLKALYTFNPNGENGVAALASVSDAPGVDKGQADSFLVRGMNDKELAKFRSITRDIFADKDANVTKWYASVRGYGSTLDKSTVEGVDMALTAMQNWTSVKLK